MPRPAAVFAALLLATISPPQRAAAQATVLSGDHVIQGRLCVGADCAANEGFSRGPLMVKENNTRIAFVDTSTTSGFATRDWTLVANDSTANGDNYFGVDDVEGVGVVFQIRPGAARNTLVVAPNGVGIGTQFPQDELHISSIFPPAITLTQNDGVTSRDWTLLAGKTSFNLSDNLGGNPLFIQAGFPSVLALSGSGVGVGTLNPEAQLHVQVTPSTPLFPHGLLIDDSIIPPIMPTAMAEIRSSRGNARLRIDERSGVAEPRTLLDLSNNGRPEIVMANTATGGEWSFGAGTHFVLKQGAVGSASSAKTNRMIIRGDNGDVEISGQIVTGGPTCSTGCDAVLAPGYDLPAIENHAARTRALGHLPALGPTLPGAPINLPEKLGGVINELEHAHLYIAALDRENDALRRDLTALAAELASLRTRIDPPGPPRP